VHQQAVVFRITAGTALDYHMISRLQRCMRHIVMGQPGGAAPFDGPPLLLAGGIDYQHVYERVWIAKQQLHDLALDRDLSIEQVGGRERMMRQGPRAR
jgi:hypothetical protein